MMTNLLNTFIDALLRIKSDDVLNQTSGQLSQNSPVDLAKELASTIKLVRAETYDPRLKTLNYDALANSLLYKRYKQKLTPALRDIDLNSFSDPKQQKAFWINLYNALVIDAVIQFKVEDSVTEGFLGIIKFFRKAAYNVAGHRFSLEDIEHGILRSNNGNPFIPGPHFSDSDPRNNFVIRVLDPRIHFAINCASVSCPPINTYTESDLDLQLDLAARNFISQEVNLSSDHFSLCLSEIFNWFRKDFGGKNGIAGYLCKYLPEGQRLEWLKKQASPRFSFTPYNWALNSPDF